MQEQFTRTCMLLGNDSAQILSGKHVMIFGVGGVGSFIAEAIARAGVGKITLVDHDTVSVTNINRQLIALHSTVGQYKTEVMAARILDINPSCIVNPLPLFYEAENRELFFSLQPDFIADAIDSVRSKTDLIASSLTRNIPIISSMGTGNRLDPSKFIITDLSQTSGDPLSRVMRSNLRKCGIVHHTVLTSTEAPAKPAQNTEGSHIVPGSVPWVPSAAGLMIAGYIIRNLLDINETG